MFLIPLYDDSPLRGISFGTYALILACTAIFLFQKGLPQLEAERMVYAYGMIPALLLGHLSAPADLQGPPIPLTLLTWMFLHGSWWHILGNALFFWVFGNNIEDSMGPGRFLVFYLTCGLVAAATDILAQPSSPIPTVGASGAIAGVLGAYLVLYPKVRVNMLFIFVIFFKGAAGSLKFWIDEPCLRSRAYSSALRYAVDAMPMLCSPTPMRAKFIKRNIWRMPWC